MLDQLVCRCRQGDRQALHELFREHGPMIQKISFRITRNHELQRDIFQDVVERVISGIGSFRGECRFTTWLYRITVNVAFSAIARERRYSGAPPDETTSPYPGAQDALERTTGKEALAHTLDAIRTLSPQSREVLSLFYFGEQSIDEIAQACGKSEGAVKAVLFKGRKAIIRELKKKRVYDKL